MDGVVIFMQKVAGGGMFCERDQPMRCGWRAYYLAYIVNAYSCPYL